MEYVVQVANARSFASVAELPEGHVYIGRARDGVSSELANRWTHKAATRAHFVVRTRDEAVECYRQWLWLQLKRHWAGETTPAVLELFALARRVQRGEQLTLVCWCAPQRCHGHIVARAAVWLALALDDLEECE